MNHPAFRAALFLLSISALHAADWPQYLGPARNGVSPETEWNTAWATKEPARLWKTDAGTGCSSIAIAEGRAYTIGHRRGKDSVLCLDALTGRKIWTHDYRQDAGGIHHEGGPSATPTVHDGKVFTVSRSGDLFCLDAATGKVLWSKNYMEDFGGRKQMYGWAASPLVHDGALIVDPGGPGASIAALDPETGITVWKNGNEEPGYASPVRFDTAKLRGYALFQKTALVGYSEKDGRELFRFPWHTDWDINASPPLFFGDKVFISSGYGSGCALIDLGNASAVYQNKNLFLHFQHGIVHGEHVYAVSGDNDTPAELKCLELATGNVLWSNRYGGSNRGNVLLVGAKLLVLTEIGELILVDPAPEAYRELDRMQLMPKTCWAPPAFANGLLYARSNKGDLRCYDFRK